MIIIEPIRDRKKIAQIKNLLRGQKRFRNLLLFVVGINKEGLKRELLTHQIDTIRLLLCNIRLHAYRNGRLTYWVNWHAYRHSSRVNNGFFRAKRPTSVEMTSHSSPAPPNRSGLLNMVFQDDDAIVFVQYV